MVSLTIDHGSKWKKTNQIKRKIKIAGSALYEMTRI
jgi:hypothetical protein